MPLTRSQITAQIQEIPELHWEEFLDEFAWKQGEHITLIGPTGCGKTTLANSILYKRDFVIALCNKPRDPLLSELGKEYTVVQSWPPPPAQFAPKILFWPPVDTTDKIPKQRESFRIALGDIYRSGGYCLYIDEIRYLSGYLKLSPLLELLWQQGRSLGVSIIGGTQRPAHIPLAAYENASHLFLWQNSDKTNRKRLGELGGVNGEIVARVVEDLPRHMFLWVNLRDNTIVKSRVEV